MRILSLCDFSGNMLKPWRDAGHDCTAVDIAYEQNGTIDGITRLKIDLSGDLGGDLSGDLSGSYDWVFAFPPCTHLASSGARWWKEKDLPPLVEALQLVDACYRLCRQAKRGWLMENPVGRLSTIWRRPDHTFDPCDYGDHYTKKTCLWTGGDFVMPPKTPVLPLEGSKMHLMGQSKDRARKRSLTPMGFALAVHKANDHTLTLSA